MQSPELWNQWLAPYQPRLPLEELVIEVNKLFHQFEAATYDRRHPQVFVEGAHLWRQMIPAALGDLGSRTWRVLDFGCGTGFASSQLLDHLGADRIEQLVCYDLSTDMLRQCRDKIAPRFPGARFSHDLAEVAASGPFNLLATNSLLHHLPDPLATLRNLEPCLSPDAVWLTGQEPSSRFYRSEACREHYENYRRQHARRQATQWRRWFSSAAWIEKARKIAFHKSPKVQTARASVAAGLFGVRPPAKLIDRLVDFHVAHSASEAAAGRGFDYQVLEQRLQPHWRLVWHTSFSFMGPVYEGSLSETWRAACRELAERHPDDGANFCAAWQRVDAAANKAA